MSSQPPDDPSRTYGRPNGLCSIPGCGAVGRLQRGWCERHYARWKRHGTPEPFGLRASPGAKLRWLDAARLVETEDCILWPVGWARHAFGYGVVRIDGRQMEAHSYVCSVAHGPAPDGAQCRHLCGVPACVNHRHLRWGSVAENSADARRHGRSGRKVTEADVAAIRLDSRSQTQIGNAYGISQSMVSQIKRGRAWRPVDHK